MTLRRRLTIREVAQAAGVSAQTVSRVLNNRPDVAHDTFLRVQQIIEETGFAPNVHARSLTKGHGHVLGVVAYGLDYFGPSQVLTGIEQQSALMGYSISLNLIHLPETDDVDGVLEGLLSRQMDGIVWAVPQVSGNRVWSRAMGREFSVPVVLMGGMADQTTLPTIAIDNRAIGRIATEHLLDGGAQRVGIVTGPLTWYEAQQRVLGWRETLQARDSAADVDLIAEGDWTPSSGEEGLYDLLERQPQLDAVFASNDQMALGILRGAHKLGRRIPEDLALVGVDDIAEASHFWPSLTTVHQPLRDAGALAVREIDRLIRQLRAGTEATIPILTLFEPELIVRESSRTTLGKAPATVVDGTNLFDPPR